MKVVLFCGGQGMRLRGGSDSVPKPMVRVGYRPILWHVMKYYALQGHTDFVLCLGFGADVIKQFFLDYEEADSNDFVLIGGSKNMLATDIDDWTITFVDTGLHAQIGQRLMRVRPYLQDDEVFLANYADGVTDLDLNEYIRDFEASGRIGGLLAVRPPQSYHVVEVDDAGSPTEIGPISRADLWLNAGYFAFRNEVFDYLERHDDIAGGVLPELIKDNQLYVHRFEGYWSPMDTFKDKTRLDAIWESGLVPWLSTPNGIR
jgi:glucose-1-phosphate cytidylyltransferase